MIQYIIPNFPSVDLSLAGNILRDDLNSQRYIKSNENSDVLPTTLQNEDDFTKSKLKRGIIVRRCFFISLRVNFFCKYAVLFI